MKNTDKIVGFVYETNDPGRFKKLVGNRAVEEGRKRKIMDSIESVGLVFNPSVVNEKFEVIEGQGRIDACAELGLPIRYVVDAKAGFDQCVQLNISATAWTQMDFITSYCELGNKNYINFKRLVEKYKGVPFEVIMYAVTGKISGGKAPKRINGSFYKSYDAVRSGELSCDDSVCMAAEEKLDYAYKFLPISRNVNGKSSCFLKAVIFAAFYAKVDKDRLYTVAYSKQQEITPFTNLLTATRSLTEIYNFGKKGRRVNIALEFEKYMEEHAASNYTARWLTETSDSLKEAK